MSVVSEFRARDGSRSRRAVGKLFPLKRSIYVRDSLVVNFLGTFIRDNFKVANQKEVFVQR